MKFSPAVQCAVGKRSGLYFPTYITRGKCAHLVSAVGLVGERMGRVTRTVRQWLSSEHNVPGHRGWERSQPGGSDLCKALLPLGFPLLTGKMEGLEGTATPLLLGSGDLCPRASRADSDPWEAVYWSEPRVCVHVRACVCVCIWPGPADASVAQESVCLTLTALLSKTCKKSLGHRNMKKQKNQFRPKGSSDRKNCYHLTNQPWGAQPAFPT